MARTARAEGIPGLGDLCGTGGPEYDPECMLRGANHEGAWLAVGGGGFAAPSHLPRAGMIFSRLPVEWRTHSAPPIEPESAGYAGAVASAEVLKTVRYLVWSRWRESCD